MKTNPGKRRKTILCQMLLGILILTSCSSVSPKDDLENEREHIETEQTETNEAAENVEVLAANRTDEEMLECILADPWFQECVWDSAGIWEKDSEKVILEKLKNCEYLDLSLSPDTLRALQNTCPYEASELRSLRDKKSACSLENLHFFPNLKTATINFHENHELLIEDFTPILQLSQLEGLSISYPMEEVDLSFLAEKDTITELSFLNCYLKDTSFLKEMSQLKRLSLDLLWEYLKPDGEKELLHYAPWQKENYEKLMGVRLPDYYYVIRDSHGAENGETGEHFHVIYCLRDGNVERYRIDDTTGKIELR